MTSLQGNKYTKKNEDPPTMTSLQGNNYTKKNENLPIINYLHLSIKLYYKKQEENYSNTQIFILITRKQYKINLDNFKLTLCSLIQARPYSKYHLRPASLIPNLADRNVANLVESQAPTRWGQIKYELCLFIMHLHKNRYIIYEAKQQIYSTTRAKNKRISVSYTHLTLPTTPYV